MSRNNIELGILGLLHAASHIIHIALPPIYILLQDEFNLSYTQIGLIGSITSFTFMLQGLAGFLVDRFGRKKLATIGMFICCISVFLYSLTPSFIVLLLLVFITGLGSSTFHPATYAMVTSKSSKESLTKKVSYHQFGGFAGTTIGISLVATLATNYGWRAAFQIIPIITLIPLVLFWLFIEKDPQIEKKQQIEKKKNRGWLNNGNITPPLIILMIFSLISAIGYGTQQFLPTFISTVYNESITSAGIFSSIMQGAGIVAMLISGVVSDRFNKIFIVLISTIVAGFFTVIFATGNFYPTLLLLIVVLWGFASKFGHPTVQTLVLLFSTESARGLAIGLRFSGMGIGGIFASSLIGYLTDIYGIRFAFLICAVFVFISSIVILFLKKYEVNSLNP